MNTSANAGGQYGGHTGYPGNDASGNYAVQNAYSNGFSFPQVHFFFFFPYLLSGSLISYHHMLVLLLGGLTNNQHLFKRVISLLCFSTSNS